MPTYIYVHAQTNEAQVTYDSMGRQVCYVLVHVCIWQLHVTVTCHICYANYLMQYLGDVSVSSFTKRHTTNSNEGVYVYMSVCYSRAWI